MTFQVEIKGEQLVGGRLEAGGCRVRSQGASSGTTQCLLMTIFWMSVDQRIDLTTLLVSR